jgi:hypothetical protein
MEKQKKQFDLITLGNLHRHIAALKVKADDGKKITPKDINEIVAIMDRVMPELQQRCNPVDSKEYGG